MKNLLYFTALILLCVGNGYGQGAFQPLNSDVYHIIDRFDIKYGKVLPVSHTFNKPYNRKWIAEYAQELDSANVKGNSRFDYNLSYLYIENSEWLKDTTISSKKPVLKFFYRDPANLYAVNEKNFTLKINPVLHVQMGYQKGFKNLRFTNTRGVELRGTIKKRLSFYTYATDNQARYMDYVIQRISDDQAVPGEGFYKAFRTNGSDYFTARGYVTFNLIDHIDIQFGHDKNFWGNGMRSLFLSDYGNNYFFLKLETTVWKIKYTNLFTEMIQTYNRGQDRLLNKKYAAFHHLNIAITHWLNIGLYEGVIFNRENGFELQYLNPIVFYRSIEQELGSADNAIVGFDFKANIVRRLSLYGQMVFDEFNFEQVRARSGWWANKFAVQGGVKYIDVAEIPNLDLQLEVNWARPFVYTHNTSATTFTHYNQPLAHPLGANFLELIGQVRYQILPELNARMIFMYAQKGTDSQGSNWGGDIFLPTSDGNGSLTVQQVFGNEVGQGVKHRIAYLDLLVSYQIRHQIYFDLNLVARNLNSDLDTQDGTEFYFGIGARMNIPYRNYVF